MYLIFRENNRDLIFVQTGPALILIIGEYSISHIVLVAQEFIVNKTLKTQSDR